MKKLCPNCEQNNQINAKYCHNCGYKFHNKQNNIPNILKNGKIFIILIITILIIGTLTITTNINTTPNNENNIHITITGVQGDNLTDKTPDYSYFTKIIISNIPITEKDGTIDGLILTTTYYTKDNQKIGETKEAINEMIDIYDYKYDEKTSTPTLWTRWFDTTDNRIPNSVTTVIRDSTNNIIAQDHYTINEKHIFDA